MITAVLANSPQYVNGADVDAANVMHSGCIPMTQDDADNAHSLLQLLFPKPDGVWLLVQKMVHSASAKFPIAAYLSSVPSEAKLSRISGAAAQERHELYFTPATFRLGSVDKYGNGRSQANTTSICAFTFDADPDGDNWLGGQWQQTAIDQIETLCGDFGLPCEALSFVDSGRGMQAYVHLDAPFDLTRAGNLERFKQANSKVREHAKANQNRYPDLARDTSHIGTIEGLMRFPGSWNKKTNRQARVLRVAAGVITTEELLAQIEALSVSVGIDLSCDRPLFKGGRNNALMSIAGRLRGDGGDETAILSQLQQVNEQRCRPPLPVNEVRAVAKSAARYPPNAKALAPGANDGASPVTLKSRRLSEIVMSAQEWLWHHYLPKGKVVVFCGPPGVGKSSAAYDLGARISSGSEFPCLNGERPCVAQAGDVLIFTTENSPEQNLKPRLVVAQAELNRIHYVDGVVLRQASGENIETAFDLARYLTMLSARLEENPDIQLVVFDPIGSFLGGKDSNSMDDMRAVLDPLAKVADEFGVTMIAIMHFNKRAEGDVYARLGGSSAFGQVSRCIYSFERVEDEGVFEAMASETQKGQQLGKMVCRKMSVGPMPDGFMYKIESAIAHEGDLISVPTSQHVWLPAMPIAPSTEIGGPKRTESERERVTLKSAAATMIRKHLSEGGRQVEWLKDAAKGEGISWRTVERAKAESTDIVARKLGNVWFWFLVCKPEVHPEHLPPEQTQ